MDRIVNVGIIGCGGIANGKHLPSLSKLPNVRLVAFCDIIVERAEKAAKEYGAPGAKVYEDYRKNTGDETKTVIASTANPYKFSGAVYEAVGGVIDTDDEFEIIDRLEKQTNTKMPAPLAATKNKEVRFTGSVEKQEMPGVVLDFLKS